MNATLAKKLRFSDAVYAIGATPKSLRLWLQRDLVQIRTPKSASGGWTEYSFFDIAILALVRQFVNYGVDVPTASAIANSIMSSYPEMLRLKNPENMPAGALATLWVNSRLHLFQTADKWEMQIVELWQTGLNALREPGFDPGLPSGVANLRREIEPAPVFLSIDVEAVLRTAFERAVESANDGAEGDGE